MLPAYGLNTGFVDLKSAVALRPKYGILDVSGSEDFEFVCPSESQMDARVGSVDSQQGKTAWIGPVSPYSWRRARWLKRRDMVVNVGCGNSQNHVVRGPDPNADPGPDPSDDR